MAKEVKNSEKAICKVTAAFAEKMAELAAAERETGYIPRLHVSDGNRKMGATPSASFPPVVHCVNFCSCKDYCYAVRMAAGIHGKDIMRAWTENAYLLQYHPDMFVSQLDAYLTLNFVPFFRWCVSGDLTTDVQIAAAVEIARLHPETKFLWFTKNYAGVDRMESIPENLHIIKSAAPGAEIGDAEKTAVCHINFADPEKNTYTGGAKHEILCCGSCSKCQHTGTGCWASRPGDAIIIEQH